MSNPYWLNPVTPAGGELGRKMGVVTLPNPKERENVYAFQWPLFPRQQYAMPNFVMNEQTRCSHHTR